MSLNSEIKNYSWAELIKKYPFANSYLDNNIPEHTIDDTALTFAEFLETLDNEYLEDKGLSKADIISGLGQYISQMLTFLGQEEEKVESVTIFPGTDKSGNPEVFSDLKIKSGDVICIVGPTGSGKSRLLADIEWVAQADTPTERTILINDQKPDSKWRFSTSHKLVAQLSQNMNFVMDLSVEEFITLHAESRMVLNSNDIVQEIVERANVLAGEKFDLSTPITSLSGGQSRALMIADTATLSKSPIVLIDEIENAGIDRKKALNLLLSAEKIVLIATHDPLLALMGDRRIVIKNGGISKVIETTEEERSLLDKIEELDSKVQKMRTILREGDTLENFIF